jgi:hypothetical protein
VSYDRIEYGAMRANTPLTYLLRLSDRIRRDIIHCSEIYAGVVLDGGLEYFSYHVLLGSLLLPVAGDKPDGVLKPLALDSGLLTEGFFRVMDRYCI